MSIFYRRRETVLCRCEGDRDVPRSGHNKRVSSDFLWDPDYKQELADVVYGASTQTLQAFAIAYRNRDAHGLRASIDLLTSDMRKLGQNRLAEKLAGARRVTEEIARREAAVDSKGAAWASLNFPIFTGMLHKLEELGRYANARGVKVVHDETREFEPVFRWWFERMKNARPGEITVGDRTMVFPFKALGSFRTVVSAQNAGVQAADVVARAICASAQAWVKHTVLPAEALCVQAMLFPAFVFAPPQFAYPIGSSAFNLGILKPAFSALSEEPVS